MLRLLLITALSLLAARAMAAEFVLYTYHDKPPYYLHADGNVEVPTGGLYTELAAILNSRQRDLQLQIAYLPRRRLDRDLESGTLNGGVIGVNPLWFKDVDQTKYLWSAPLMRDQDVVVVRKGGEFAYKHPRGSGRQDHRRGARPLLLGRDGNGGGRQDLLPRNRWRPQQPAHADVAPRERHHHLGAPAR